MSITTPPPAHSSGVASIGQTVECFGEYTSSVKTNGEGFNGSGFPGSQPKEQTFTAPEGLFKVVSFFGKWARLARVSDEEIMFAWPAAQLTVKE